MGFKLPQSHTFKQILGAAGGMAVAGILYFGYQQVDNFQLSKAMIVDLNNAGITENAGEVSINDQNPDDRELIRLQTRAQEVARQLEESRQQQANQPQAPTELEQNTDERLAARQKLVARFAAATHAVAPDTWTDNDNRVQMRAERALAAQNGQSVVQPTEQQAQQPDMQYLGVFDTQQPVVYTEPVVEDAHAGAKLTQTESTVAVAAPTATRLTNSGDGLGLIAFLALMAGVVYHYGDPLRRRLVALTAVRDV